MEILIGALTVFVLAIFVGFEVITKVPPIKRSSNRAVFLDPHRILRLPSFFPTCDTPPCEQ